MRTLSAPVVLSSLALTGWLTTAAAQDTGVPQPPAVATATNEAETNASQGDLAAGVLPLPTLNSPGMSLGIKVGELYTDNVRLAGPGTPKQSSWITQIEPFFDGAWNTPRIQGVIHYSLTGYLYAGQVSSHQLAQNLNAQGQLTVLPQHFFIDGTATYERAIVNNQLPSGSGTFFLSGNRANIATASVSPWWTQDFGELGTATVRYTHARVMYNRSGISDENSNLLAGVNDINSDAVQAQLVNPPGLTVGWNLDFTSQRLTAGHDRSVRFATAKAGTYWQVRSDLRLLADAGLDNRYRADGSIGTLDAPFWDVGFEWSTPRNFVNLLVGHRFYGRSARFSWVHTAALLTTDVSYIERPTDLNQQLVGTGSIDLLLPPTAITSEIPSLAERRIYLMKRATVSATYQMPNGNLRLSLYDESRRFFANANTLANTAGNTQGIIPGNDHEKVQDADLTWLINLGPLTTLTPTVGWQRYKFDTGQINYNRFAQLSLVHQLNAKNFGTLRVRRDSSNVFSPAPGARGYDVDVIFLQWTHLF